MKKSLALLLFLSAGLLSILYCSEDASPTRTDEESYTLVETITIGTGGGVLDNDELILVVPSGAFAEPQSISLLKSEENQEFGEESASPSYKITGLPSTILDTLKLRIKYDGTLSEESYIALGTQGFDRSFGGGQISYILFPATDSTGHLLCDIPIPEEDTSSQTSTAYKTSGATWDWICEIVTKMRTRNSAGNNFKISYPFSKVSDANASALGTYLETAYSHFQNKGFSYSKRKEWPISVTIKDMGQTVYGGYTSTIWGKNGGYMEFNSRFLSNTNEIRTTAGHEFFHFVQELYDPRGAWSIAGGKNYFHYWLDEAMAVWCERFFVTTPNFVSLAFSGNEKEPFSGVHIDFNNINAQDHGYGMAPLIEDLYSKHSDPDQMILEIYQNILDKNHPVKAVIDAIPSLPNWWSFFFEEYMTGNYYNIFGDNFVNSVPDSFIIDEDFVEVSHTDAFQDLSARMYVIELTRPDFGTNDVLKLKATGTGVNPDILVFRYRPANWDVIADQKDSVMIGDLAQMVLDGWGMAAIVVNQDYTEPSYLNKTDIEFSVELVEPPELDQTDFVFGYQLHAFWETTYGSPYEREQQTSQYCCSDTGSFKNYTFTATWDKPFTNGTKKGSLTATVNPEVNKIISFTVKDTTVEFDNQYPDQHYVTEITGANIPLSSLYDGNLYFRLDGTTACNGFTTFSHFIAANGDTARIVNKECNENSHLSITFLKNP